MRLIVCFLLLIVLSLLALSAAYDTRLIRDLRNELRLQELEIIDLRGDIRDRDEEIMDLRIKNLALTRIVYD